MKWNLTGLLMAAAIAFLPLKALAAPETYTIDPSHSYVLWTINHFGFSNPSGKWFTEGTIVLDQAKPENSKVNITIQMASIDTGISELDKHLKGPSFFDVEKYPTATFTSSRVKVTGKNMAQVTGVLTLHGVSKPEVVKIKLNKSGENPINNKETVGFSGTTQVKRSDFGINTLLPGLSDNVKINIEVEATKA
jgi:polyisoprenoid-binding protein YceI